MATGTKGVVFTPAAAKKIAVVTRVVLRAIKSYPSYGRDVHRDSDGGVGAGFPGYGWVRGAFRDDLVNETPKDFIHGHFDTGAIVYEDGPPDEPWKINEWWRETATMEGPFYVEC